MSILTEGLPGLVRKPDLTARAGKHTKKRIWLVTVTAGEDTISRLPV